MPPSETTGSWVNEIEFSNWLHENIQILGAVLELELVSRRREAPVGRLSADILANIQDSDEVVIIENQIHPADHGHFGQILTYAGHHDAHVIVWIASSFRNEYRHAFAWLNSFSHKRFYAVELRRDDVVTAFHVVARPDAASAPSDLGPSQVVLPLSKHARASTQAGAYVSAPFAAKVERQATPGQLAPNAIFERIATLLVGSRIFSPLRAPTGDRNYYVLSSGPTRASEWSIVFTDEGVRLELVFNDRQHASQDIERIAGRAHELRTLLAREIVFDAVPTRVKQKAIIHHALTVEERYQDAEGVAVFCAQTITLFAEAVATLGIYQ